MFLSHLFMTLKKPNFHYPKKNTLNHRLLQFLFLCLLAFTSCNPLYQATRVNHKEYKVMNMRTDSTVQKFLRPYRDSMSSSMTEVLGQLETDLEKNQPECTLGNFMVDAMYSMAQKKYGITPDAAFMNFGGIRLPSIKAGTITKGKIYELFPFDNILLLVKIKGDVLQQFLDHISARGGWPVAGMTMQIQNKKAVNVLIGGNLIDAAKQYTIAIGDYTANGGDDAAMLKELPQINNGYLMRDALIDYVKTIRTIKVQLQKRVTNAE